MKWMITGVVAAMLVAGAAVTASKAEDDPIKAREAIMKDNGRQAKIVGDMLQGKTAFDAAAAKAALQTMAADLEEFPTHFPEGSDKGDTEALPAIWQNKADFEARAKKLSDDATAAAAAADQGEAAFKPAAMAVFGNCKGCHELYRKAD